MHCHQQIHSVCELESLRFRGHPPGYLPYKKRDTRPDVQNVDLATLVCHIVGISLDIDPEKLLSEKRGTAKVARARQMAMYLLHTSFSLSLTEVAQAFSRDRTTIGHACRLVEDMRDQRIFERRLSTCEGMVALVNRLIGESDEGQPNVA